MGLFDDLFKFKTENSTLRLFKGKTGDYIKSSGNGRKGKTEAYKPHKKKQSIVILLKPSGYSSDGFF